MPAPMMTTRARSGMLRGAAGCGWGEPRRLSDCGMLDLLSALRHELLQLLVDRRVDARVFVVGQHPLPLLVRDPVGGPGAEPVPTVEVLRRRDQRPVEAGPVVTQRVLGTQEVATRADF